MDLIRRQIHEKKQAKKDYLNEFYYLDYCNNCKTGLASKYDIPCHHQWYCWHTDEDGIGDLQRQIIELSRKQDLTSQEYHRLKELKTKQYKISRERLKKWRRNNL